ncbi:MAG: Phospho-2-dehydro-3-deoxyheptonate aldolase [Marinimicrobia bacterium 46_47]|nr:MAG: Phospho-2-dehydro-3-deoxyheptonate aldolase [Marinimicrobia bacterium 46_47]KUK91775.1 MAG: 3-deoxy-7-phosphoheptulonate synthase [Marinimicrobia bacterium 46_43]HBY18164.1 3-deoxy-7-phosphoheptulonate synthase [Candidatus Neomarinimicrobiota bacterium]
MIIVMNPGVKEAQIEQISEHLHKLDLKIHKSQGEDHMILGVIGDISRVDIEKVKGFEGVNKVIRISESYKQCSRTFKPTNTIVHVGKVPFGGREIAVIAGPCSVENEKMVHKLSREIKRYGAHVLRGGAYKPRSSPYTFQGLGEEGLKYLQEAAFASGIPCVSEVMAISDIDLFCRYVDALQVGARNMQNYSLLKALGTVNKPVILKRGISATVEEWLNAAEYIVNGGNSQVILCERGIRTFENSTRFTLDLSSVPVVKKLSHLPIIVDPSHAMGNRDLVVPMARAAVAAGADGIMVEVHDDPNNALSDGPQSLYPKQFNQLMKELYIISQVIGRGVLKK